MPFCIPLLWMKAVVPFEQMFEIDFRFCWLLPFIVAAYVISGGIKGFYTDALQAVICFVCMLFLLFWFTSRWISGLLRLIRKLSIWHLSTREI